jgi:hypothetical protein
MQDQTNHPDTSISQIRPANPADVQVIDHGRDIHIYRLTDIEVKELCSGYTSLDFGLFTLCAGFLVAFSIALATTQMSDKLFAAFSAIIAISSLGGLFFGARTLKERQRLKSRAQQIMGTRRISI